MWPGATEGRTPGTRLTHVLTRPTAGQDVQGHERIGAGLFPIFRFENIVLGSIHTSDVIGVPRGCSGSRCTPPGREAMLLSLWHGAKTVGTGWGTNNVGFGPSTSWPYSFQKKQEISQQVVTRMQDLASEFSKIFRDDTVGPSQREGATPSRTQHQARHVLGPKVPFNFSAVVAPLVTLWA